MIFLFKDDYNSDNEYNKVIAQDIEEAILKVLKKQLKDGLITVEEICDNLDYKLINVDSLEEYE